MIIHGVIDLGMEYSLPGLIAAYICRLTEAVSSLGGNPFCVVVQTVFFNHALTHVVAAVSLE